MKSFVIKFLTSILLILVVLSFFYNVLATTATSQFGGTDIRTEVSAAGTKITSVLSIVLNVVRTVGVGLAVIILTVIGCKYMLASAGDRAEIKKHAIAYVIGAVVLFGASAILTVLQEFATKTTAIS